MYQKMYVIGQNVNVCPAPTNCGIRGHYHYLIEM